MELLGRKSAAVNHGVKRRRDARRLVTSQPREPQQAVDGWRFLHPTKRHGGCDERVTVTDRPDRLPRILTREDLAHRLVGEYQDIRVERGERGDTGFSECTLAV